MPSAACRPDVAVPAFPALHDFERDPDVNYARWRVYTLFRRGYLVFHRPRAVKIGSLERQIPGERGQHIRRNLLIDAINWLVRRGYVEEHGRDGRVRLLSLVYARSYPEATNSRAA